MRSSVFVVVPAFNEGSVILTTVQHLTHAGYTVVVVDDGSTDGTAEFLANLPIYLLRHAINLGQGAALQTGMSFALENGADVVVHFDADGQHKVEDIETLIRPLLSGEADVVLGSRFLRDGDRLAVPPLRRLMLKTAVVVNRLATGFWLTDAHNGLRALTADAAKRIHLRENGFAHATEIVDEIGRAGLRYVERPTSITYTDYSKAKGQSIWNAFNITVDLLLKGLFK